MNYLFPILIFSLLLEIFQIVSVGNHGITVWDVTLLSMTLIFLKKLFWDGFTIKYHKSLIPVALVGLMVSIILSSYRSVYLGDTDLILQLLKSSIHFMFNAIILYISFFADFKLKSLVKSYKILIISSIFINIYAVYQLFARAFDLPFAWVISNNISSLARKDTSDFEGLVQAQMALGDFFRATSIFSEPSALAGFNVFILIILLTPIIHKTKHFVNSKFLINAAIVSVIIGLFLTYSMSGVLLLSTFSFLIFLRNPWQLLKIGFISVIIALILLKPADNYINEQFGISIFDTISKRIYIILGGDMNYSISGESYDGRVANVEQMVHIWKKSPYLGIGMGLTHYNRDTKDPFSDTTIFSVLGEMGILGVIFYLFFIIAILIEILLSLKKMQSDDKSHLKSSINLAYYFFGSIFVTNFLVGNQLSNVGFWVYIPLIIIPIKHVQSLSGNLKNEVRLFPGLKYSLSQPQYEIKKMQQS